MDQNEPPEAKSGLQVSKDQGGPSSSSGAPVAHPSSMEDRPTFEPTAQGTEFPRLSDQGSPDASLSNSSGLNDARPTSFPEMTATISDFTKTTSRFDDEESISTPPDQERRLVHIPRVINAPGTGRTARPGPLLSQQTPSSIPIYTGPADTADLPYLYGGPPPSGVVYLDGDWVELSAAYSAASQPRQAIYGHGSYQPQYSQNQSRPWYVGNPNQQPYDPTPLCMHGPINQSVGFMHQSTPNVVRPEPWHWPSFQPHGRPPSSNVTPGMNPLPGMMRPPPPPGRHPGSFHPSHNQVPGPRAPHMGSRSSISTSNSSPKTPVVAQVYNPFDSDEANDDASDSDSSLSSSNGSSSTKPATAPRRPDRHLFPKTFSESLDSDRAASTAAREWERQKKELGDKNEALDHVMAMVGIEHAKLEFLKVKATIDAARTRKGRLRRQALNLALMGNPGTGKRTLAGLYRKFLSECGVWPAKSPGLIEYKVRSGATLDVEDLDKDLADSADGLVLHIDSVECLNSDHHAKLINVLDWHAEKLVVVLSGSSRGIMQLLGSRWHGRWEFWRRLKLKDYSDEQLRLILLQLIRHNSLTLVDGDDSRYLLVAAMRVGRNRGSEGFGNVHDLIMSFEKMLDRHSARMDREREAVVDTTDVNPESDVLADGSQHEGTEHNDDELKDDQPSNRDDGQKAKELEIKNPGDEKEHGKIEDRGNTRTVDQQHVDEAAVTEKVKNEEVKDKKVEQQAAEERNVEDDKDENEEGKSEEAEEQEARDRNIGDDKDVKVNKDDKVEKEESKSEEIEDQEGKNEKIEDLEQEKVKSEEIGNEEAKNGDTEPEEAKDEMADDEEVGENIDKDQPPRPFFLTMEDILGTEPMELQFQSDAWNELKQMAGLANVKKAVGELVDRARVNHRRELAGKERLHMSLNRLFLGPPGTGKSTVARLYGQILADYGLVSSNEVVVKTPGDFISEYIGESETNTSAILDSTIGKVLIIDDAHMFYQEEGFKSRRTDDYRLGCIDVIVSKVHNKPGEDRCVILVGYTEGMEEMLRNTNPGLRRRFPLEQAFVFTDYDDEDLNRILRLKMASEQITASQPAMDVAAEVLRRMRDRPNFGNGGDVGNLLDQAKARFVERTTREAERKKSAQEASKDAKEMEGKPENEAESLEDLGEDETTTLEREDFDPEWNRGENASEKCRLLFQGLIGFEVIIDQLQGYQRMAANMRRLGRDPRQRVPFTFLFKGPPGTGKTHTGRIVGQVFYDMGFLSTNEVIECSASHLISQWVGGTAPKVVDLLDRALGKVLLIDEAYRLAVKGSRSSGVANYEEEAVGELVDAMTKPRYLHKLVIVLAGYERGIDLLMRLNPGLRGRFATEIMFRPMTPRQCKTHLVNLIRKDGIAIWDGPEANDEDQKTVLLLFSKLALTPGWANARDVETLAGIIATDIYQMEPAELDIQDDADPETPFRITTKDLIEYLNGMMRQRVRESSK